MTGLEARDLNEISGGRFVLGVGTGNLHFNDLYMGIDSSKAKAKMQDFMEIVRLVVKGRLRNGFAIRVTYTASAGGRPGTQQRQHRRIYMSASGPNMVRLAGAVSDGVGIGIMSSVEFVRDIVRPNARLGAEQAGRDPDALLFPTAATVSINKDEEAARRPASEPSVSSITQYLTRITTPSCGSWALPNSPTKQRGWFRQAD